MNKMATKTNHYQELLKMVEKGKGMKNILVTNTTSMKPEIQKLQKFRRKRANKKKEAQKLKDEQQKSVK